MISPENERDSSETLGKLADNAAVKIIEGSKLHGTFMFGKVRGIEKRVLDFVEQHIGESAKNPVLASLKSQKYHVPTCRYATPDPDNRYAVRAENLHVFSSAAEAEARGYTPCKRCAKANPKRK